MAKSGGTRAATGLLAAALLAAPAGLQHGASAAAPPEAATAAEPVRLVTANVPFTLAGAKARAQLRHVATSGAHVATFQEVRTRKVGRVLDRETSPGKWAVHQPAGAAGASAVAWDKERFAAVDKGSRLAFRGPDYSRHLLWVTLRERSGGQQYTVIGLHYPPNASKDPKMRELYRTMNANYRALVGDLKKQGRHPVAGGDWNNPLDVPREPWGPVQVNKKLSMTTNWQQGTACKSGSSARGGRIDGFAYAAARYRLQQQGCMKRLHSDHRPVWMTFTAG
ncbi:hypothetical protein JGS22_023445 [Streptomyces sp. P38-E01]|uniref:Endonuclease/exonuclease/phosphatase domain-containing protein n=1 Tax=Streptomyces tardus TaxID=2780544 RepID=A0A949NAC5_9ACTN|nr:hypothetical protein [Streptomyces tardus]MBU7600501.1 hypothetical protein [Streptomyces tardus]